MRMYCITADTIHLILQWLHIVTYSQYIALRVIHVYAIEHVYKVLQYEMCILHTYIHYVCTYI